MFAASDPQSGSVIAKAAIASPCATRGSHSRFCSIVPNRRDRARSEALHGEGEIRERAMIGEGLAGDGEAAHVGPVLAVGDRELEEAGRAELAHQGPAFAVEVVGVTAGEIVFAPLVELVGKLAMLRLEEGPAKVSHPGTPASAWPRRPRKRA